LKKLRFGFTGGSDKLQQSSIKLGQCWYLLFAVLGSAAFGISTAYIGNFEFCAKFNEANEFKKCLVLIWSPWALALCGVIAMFYGGKGTYIDLENLKLENDRLKEENSKVEQLKKRLNSAIEDSESLQNKLSESHVKLVTTWLKGCSKQNNLKTHDRITIYFCVEDHFYVLARYSQNPKFAEIHRQKFSKIRGVICEAWEHKVCIDIDSIPSYSNDPDGYKAYMSEKYGYEEKRVDALTMKSCQYVATSISEADNPLGVIIFESDQEGYYKTQKVNQLTKFCTEHQSYLVDFIRYGIKYNKSVKVASKGDEDVDHEFLANFQGGGEV
jgi:hypothetical protein